MKEHDKSVTLLELLIAIVLLSIVVLGLTSIDFFSRNNVVNADIRARLQNKVYLALEHMRKNIILAIGNENLDGADQVVDISDTTEVDEKARMKVFTDVNLDGVRQTPVGPPPAVGDDHWVVYNWFGEQGAAANWFQLRYCSYCRNKQCNGANCAAGWQVVSSNVINFIPIKPSSVNYVDVEMTVCLHPEWNYDANPDCGAPDNPQTTMRTRILLPSVSVN